MSLASVKEKLISFVFQDTCCFCGQAINGQDRAMAQDVASIACNTCFEQVVGNPLDRCYHCSAQTTFENPFGSRCRICRNWPDHFERAFAIGHYCDAVKSTVLEIKRDSNDIKAYQLGKLLGLICAKFDMPDTVDGVVPVPSHWRRRFGRRGFHVSDVIAEGFCQFTGLTKIPALKCQRFTKKQAKLGPAGRIKNVRGAFAVNSRTSFKDRQILLLDDVMTSGATVSECAKILTKAGASAVFVAVAARATGIS